MPVVGGHLLVALVVLVVLVAANVWVHVGPRRLHLVTQPVAALLLLLLGRAVGLSWADLGLAAPTARVGVLVGLAGAVLITACYALALAVPATRGAFLDTRYDVDLRSALWTSAVAIPLSTVVLEETAFRGVVWGLVMVESGPVAATVVSSALFGLWHVLPALDLARTSTAIGGAGLSRRRRVVVVASTVLGTALAGVVLAELRRRTGSLLAPVAVHWTANGIGVLASAWVWRRRRARGGSLSGDEAGQVPVRTLMPCLDKGEGHDRHQFGAGRRRAYAIAIRPPGHGSQRLGGMDRLRRRHDGDDRRPARDRGLGRTVQGLVLPGPQERPRCERRLHGVGLDAPDSRPAHRSRRRRPVQRPDVGAHRRDRAGTARASWRTSPSCRPTRSGRSPSSSSTSS